MPRTSRRTFLRQIVWSSMGATLVLVPGCRSSGRLDEPAAGAACPSPTAPAFFTPVELLALTAACERLLPRDEEPGAIDLGVPDFIDRMLGNGEYPKWRRTIRDGLAELDRQAMTAHADSFHLVSETDQDAILAAVQDSKRTKPFFNRLVHLTLEGAFGDPLYGGNRALGGWKLIGFAGEPCSAEGLVQIGKKGARS